ncbi:MAG: competence protein ComK [Bacilli bacterium]|nr:competence protein ComK [Bacilli bacterium]
MSREGIFYLVEEKSLERTTHELHYANKQIIPLKQSCAKFLNELCLSHFTTLKGRLDAIKQRFSFHKNTPIFINEHLILVTVKENNRKFYLNYFKIAEVKSMDKGKSLIAFVDGSSLILNVSITVLQNRIKSVERLLKEPACK